MIDIERNTGWHPPKNDDVKDAHWQVRAATKSFMKTIAEYCPESRERSVALTKAEEAMMWANAGIARNLSHD